MTLRYCLIVLSILTCCSKPNTDATTSNQSQDGVDTDGSDINIQDSLSYIGFIGKFEDNNSFYTDLYFANGFDYDLYDKVQSMNEGVVFKDEEITRTKISKAAEQYFNMTGFENINIYNKENAKLASGHFSHIEYVDNMIEGRFVAVFNLDNNDISDYLFCIGNPEKELDAITLTTFEDRKLDEALISHLRLNSDHHSNINHSKINGNVIYSTVSADTVSYITETVNNTYKTLYESESDEIINGVIIVARKINGRPVLLADFGMQETDMTWTALLVFNGSKYAVDEDHRIKR